MCVCVCTGYQWVCACVCTKYQKEWSVLGRYSRRWFWGFLPASGLVGFAAGPVGASALFMAPELTVFVAVAHAFVAGAVSFLLSTGSVA